MAAGGVPTAEMVLTTLPPMAVRPVVRRPAWSDVQVPGFIHSAVAVMILG